MTYCSVPNCGSRASPDLSLFVPPQDTSRRLIWHQFLRINGKCIERERIYKICELHFEADQCYLSNTRKYLIRDAIPTLTNCHKVSKLLIFASFNFELVELAKNVNKEIFSKLCTIEIKFLCQKNAKL